MKKLLVLVLILTVVACSTQVEQPIKETPEEPAVPAPAKQQTDIGDVEGEPEDIQAEAKPATKTQTLRSPKDHKISIMAYKFNPKTLNIKKGDRVIWENLGNTPHEVKTHLFHSNPLQKGDSFSHVFTKLGNFTVNSHRYPATQGKIIVE